MAENRKIKGNNKKNANHSTRAVRTAAQKVPRRKGDWSLSPSRWNNAIAFQRRFHLMYFEHCAKNGLEPTLKDARDMFLIRMLRDRIDPYEGRKRREYSTLKAIEGSIQALSRVNDQENYLRYPEGCSAAFQVVYKSLFERDFIDSVLTRISENENLRA